MKNKGALGLIKQFFGLTLAQAKEENSKLTADDVAQLGSAIAREQGTPVEDLKFELVPY
jgi:hypothetical protein